VSELDGDVGAGVNPRPRGVSAAMRHSRLNILAVTAVLTFATDVVTKIIAVDQLSGRRHPVEVFGSVFNLELVRNPGAAFGLGVGMTIVFSLVSLAVIVAILRAAPRLGSIAWALVFGLVLGGALGNLSDRILRSPGFGRGHVVDFLHITHWPVFNVADSAFTVAGAIVVLLAIRNVPLEGTRRRAGRTGP